MNHPRTWAWLMAVLAGSYALLAGWRGWFLLSSGDLIQILFGAAIIVFPLLGMWLIWRELMFGFAMQHMGRALAAEAGLPPAVDRARPEQADEELAEAMARAEASPSDWRAWYRMGLAYDALRERKQARAAMRQAWQMSPYSR